MSNKLFANLSLIVVCSAFGLAISCKKETTVNAKLSANYSGSLYMGSGTTFTSSNSSASSYRWDFGDGTTSTEAKPTHSYAAAGNYTATLWADNDSTSVTFRITPGAGRFGGSRTWKGGHYHLAIFHGSTYDSSKSDTTFNIIVENDSTITMWGKTTPYNHTTRSFYLSNGVDINAPELIYRNDSLFFSYHSTGVSLAQDLKITWHNP